MHCRLTRRPSSAAGWSRYARAARGAIGFRPEDVAARLLAVARDGVSKLQRGAVVAVASLAVGVPPMTPGGRTRRASEWGQDGTWLASASPPLGWARGGALACELAQERSRCAVPDRRHVGSLSPVRPLVQSCTHRDQGRGGPDAQSGSGVSLSPLTMWISTQSQCSLRRTSSLRQASL